MIKLLFILMTSVLLMADIGKITVVKGDAHVLRNIKEISAYHPMPLFKHDIVETQDGRLQMQFIDNTVISLGRESRFSIEEYLYLESSDHAVASFKIEKGFVKTITGAIGKMMPELFAIYTSTTKITPNGTIWSIDVRENREEYKVMEGKITLAFNDGSDKTIELRAGESMILQRDTKDSKKIANSLKTESKSADFEKSVERDQAAIAEEKKLYRHKVEPVVEEPTVEEPVVEEPTVEEPIIEEPVVEEPVIEEPEDDGNNGIGNDPDKIDPSNPGQSKDKEKVK